MASVRRQADRGLLFMLSKFCYSKNMGYSLEELHEFLGKATKATYAGNGGKAQSQRIGFTEFEYAEGKFAYRDSYAGFFTSAGQEVVWYGGNPIWTQQYSGGMERTYQNDKHFANQTYEFLKIVLSQGEKTVFQPRGPKEFAQGEWKYICEWTGDIASFEGQEQILHKDEVVFRHSFSGGVLRG